MCIYKKFLSILLLLLVLRVNVYALDVKTHEDINANIGARMAVADMGEINAVRTTNSYAEYDLFTIRNGMPYSFHILFVRDLDGIWKIETF